MDDVVGVVLRESVESDLDVLFEHWVDPESNWMAAFTSAEPNDRRAFDERWRRLRENEDTTTRVIEVAGEVVGSIGSWTGDGGREVTYWIGRTHWGRGIATAALRQFLAEVDRRRPMLAATAFDNLASQRVLEKCGFRRVGAGTGAPSNARGTFVEETLFRLDR